MIRPRAVLTAPRIAALLACLALLVLVPAAAASAAEEEGGSSTTATPTVVYTPETYTVFKTQLANGEVKSVTINKRLRSLRVTLRDGRTVLAKYEPKERPAVESALRAARVKFAILSAEQAKQEQKAKSKPKHKIRYIAGGVLLVIVIVVVVVLLIRRRRRASADY
jgi:hypothetical protein